MYKNAKHNPKDDITKMFLDRSIEFERFAVCIFEVGGKCI